jgi:hypothetical protein
MANKLLSLKAYNELVKIEMTYCRGMKGTGWKDFNGENPHKEHHGDENWEVELKNALALQKYK